MNIADKYQRIWMFRKIKRKLTRKPLEFCTYAGRRIMPLEEANELMAQWIQEKKVFSAGRFGSIELKATWNFDLHQNNSAIEKLLFEMQNNAGFFPRTLPMLEQFSEIMKVSTAQMDLLGVWFNPMEDYVIERYGENAQLTHLTALEPWYVDNPWTKALEGRKVLVIHPFAETIKRQYRNRKYLFSREDILPEFGALYTLKAVQTIAGIVDERFQNWFEALEWMFEEAMQIDFDIAIIGCGAYGFPLAAKIKKAGRSAVHMGGAAQLLFGIKGRRWDHHPIIGQLYNDYWVRPGIDEKPAGAENVEEGCYW